MDIWRTFAVSNSKNGATCGKSLQELATEMERDISGNEQADGLFEGLEDTSSETSDNRWWQAVLQFCLPTSHDRLVELLQGIGILTNPGCPLRI
ncbi:hypothetical protein NPIL_651411 [Nephila pilipes]|uniref:Uncharacterized protein n=1 Tax=Nephila pilipes TaxID=299642 RepID=A0A8X6MRY9_NEPPI|nr:hypothetical protein NPIL_651411 [Nephila pilipes]